MNASGCAAYVSEAKIYPREMPGRWHRLRSVAAVALLGVFYVLPWVTWHGHQAVLFDLPARKFYVLGLTFWPQDFLFLALLLIIAALSLFFFTAIAGRVWCGYACPQTVWTEMFLLVERWIEGPRSRRMKLDAMPWSAAKVLRKGGKHLAWIVLAGWTGVTFVGFFTPASDLVGRLPSLQWSGWEAFWVLFYAVATWGNAGFLREQVCKYMCPYARFQSAMFDRDTLIIAYDAARGEPRGSRGKGLGSVLARGRGLLPRAIADAYVRRAYEAGYGDATARGTITFDSTVAPSGNDATKPSDPPGDCVDCTMCVQVCPTGIDIRNGLQYECIACGACIDACDTVMQRVGYEQGLIRYSTQHALDGQQTHVLRPRVLVYAALLVVLVCTWAWGILHRETLVIDALRDRNALYVIAADGRAQNSYTLKIANKAEIERLCALTLADTSVQAGLQLQGAPLPISLRAAEVTSLGVVVRAAATLHGRHDLTFLLRCADTTQSWSIRSSFFGPSP